MNKERVVLLQKPIIGVKPSPYEARTNYKILKDYFKVHVIEGSQGVNSANQNHFQMKYHSNPINMANKFNEPIVYEHLEAVEPNTSR